MIISVGKAVNRHEDNVYISISNETMLKLLKKKIDSMTPQEMEASMNVTLFDLVEGEVAKIGYKKQISMAEYVTSELQNIE